MSLAPGTRIGTYEITGPIGAGGMGEVYRARDTKLHRDVAIKILPEGFATDADRVARFSREAQTLAALNHPHIAQIYAIEEAPTSGGPGVGRAIVMELVDGEDLSQRLAHGPIPVEDAVSIARQVAEALEAAHEHGIVHRDLKPANVKLTSDGNVKVLDFGLAKALTDRDASSAGLINSPTFTSPAMTQHGMILGTAAYMSPEQAKGKVADRRSDVWAFGSVLYEMLSGRRAFEGEDVSDTLAAVLRGSPDYSLLPEATPPPIRALIARCLERDRRKRVSSLSTALFVIDEADKLAPASSPATDDAAIDARIRDAEAKVRRTFIKRRFAPSVVALTLMAIALAFIAFRPRPVAPLPVTRFSIPFPEGFSRTQSGRLTIAISNDGQTLAYIVNQQLAVRAISEFAHRIVPLTGFPASPINTPVFAPDDRSLAFHSAGDSSIKRISLAGGAPITVCAVRAPFGMTWHETGLIIGAGPDGIIRCPGNRTPERLIEMKGGELATNPHLLPDGDTLLFGLATTTDNVNAGASIFDAGEIVVQQLSTGERTTIARGNNPRYVSTGHILYTVGGVVFGVAFDAKRRQPVGEPVPVIEGVRRAGIAGGGTAHLVISKSGALLYLPGSPSTAGITWSLATADLGGTVSRLPTQPGAYDQVRVSPDGTQLVVGTDDSREAIVWLYDMQQNMPMRRLTHLRRNRFPLWHPDGRRVAFQSDREGDAGIFIQRVDDTASAERLTKTAATESHVPNAWTPDGQHLLFSSFKDGVYSLHTYSVSTRQSSAVAGIQSREPIGAVVSSDGRWMAYASTPLEGGTVTTDRGIFVQPFPATGSKYQGPSQSLNFHPAWRPKSHDLVYVPSAASGELSVVTISDRNGVSFSSPVKGMAAVTGQRTSGMFRAWDILPDGRFVGIVTGATVDDAGSPPEMRVVLGWFEELKQKIPTSQ